MTEAQNLTLSVANASESERSGFVNLAHAATEDHDLESPAEEKASDLEPTVSKTDLVDDEEVKTDEWWNYVQSLVESEEAKEPDKNSNIPR